MSQEKVLLHCYNRGCGQKFDPSDNKDGDCVHHPGAPVFHDAYKGWSCCKKRCTDFTEFLSIKGCTKGSHSNQKPAEPEKPAVNEALMENNVKVEPLTPPMLKRPDFDEPRVTMEPVVSPSLLEQIKGLSSVVKKTNDAEITVGQSCHNKSCKATYRGLHSLSEVCNHHPGMPVFHEGLKYWSCCQKKTTDFTVFLAQPGCTEGTHEWVIKDKDDKRMNCRMDWHQTGSFVVVSIFAKKYQPSESTVRLNPIRMTVDLFFIEEDSRYNLDIELRGIVDVEKSSVAMLPTKVEIKLKKAEPGSWSHLSFPRSFDNKSSTQEVVNKEEISNRVEAVDLSDL